MTGGASAKVAAGIWAAADFDLLEDGALGLISKSLSSDCSAASSMSSSPPSTSSRLSSSSDDSSYLTFLFEVALLDRLEAAAAALVGLEEGIGECC